MTDRDPDTMNRYIQQVVDNALKEVHTCMPGRIESFDEATQIARIQPLIRRVFVDNQEFDLPLCINCPVVFPRGGGFVMTFPVIAGDECLICFSERSLDTWLQSGGIQSPLDTRRHSLSDAIAILGLYSQPNKVSSFHGTGVEIKNDAGSIYFRLDDTGISIKGNVDIEGDIDITGKGDIGSTLDVVGNSTALDHKSGTISGKTHIHPHSLPNTGVPIP